MQTLPAEKIDNLLEQIIYCDLRTSVGVDKAKKAIRLALKKQDGETRLACIDAVFKAGGHLAKDMRCQDAIRAINDAKAA